MKAFGSRNVNTQNAGPIFFCIHWLLRGLIPTHKPHETVNMGLKAASKSPESAKRAKIVPVRVKQRDTTSNSSPLSDVELPSPQPPRKRPITSAREHKHLSAETSRVGLLKPDPPPIPTSSSQNLPSASSSTLVGSSLSDKKRDRSAALQEDDMDTEDGGLFDEAAVLDNILNGSFIKSSGKSGTTPELEDTVNEDVDVPVFVPTQLPAG